MLASFFTAISWFQSWASYFSGYNAVPPEHIGLGERRERTEWHRVVIFNEGLCRVAEQYLKKGSKVYLEGQLQTRKWQDQSGQDKYTTEVVLQSFNSQLTMLDRAGDRAGGEFGGEEDDFGSSGPSAREKKPALAGAGKRGDMDD